jgi:hypothetical protein
VQNRLQRPLHFAQALGVRTRPRVAFITEELNETYAEAMHDSAVAIG